MLKKYNITLKDLIEVISENKFSKGFERGAYDDEVISLEGFLLYLKREYGFQNCIYLEDFSDSYDFDSYGLYGDWTKKKYDKIFAKHILIQISEGFVILPCHAHSTSRLYLQPNYIRFLEDIDREVIKKMISKKEEEIKELKSIL